jgi:uncharacterized membrane protein
MYKANAGKLHEKILFAFFNQDYFSFLYLFRIMENNIPINITSRRIESIDMIRGLVMVIMALDHTRDYFHFNAFGGDPMDPETTTPFLFFTRWITHFCAPIFVMLSGTSAFLYGNKKSKKELFFFLFTRGFWLMFLEVTVVRLGWTFNIFPNSPFMFQVIWAIGLCMVILSGLIWLNKNAVLTIGILIVLFHNILDPIGVKPENPMYVFWAILHDPLPIRLGAIRIFTLYPVLPWLGIMCIGFGMGQIFTSRFQRDRRKKILLISGASAIILFIALRFTNLYGNGELWGRQPSLLYTVFSFLNVEKYPPSLLFTLMTLGPACILLAFAEKISGKISGFFVTIGRVPLFYYILHLYFIHLGILLVFFLNGGKLSDINYDLNSFNGMPPGYGFGLPWVYVAWIMIVLLLYPLCKWYGKIKQNSTWKGWSYL